MRRPVEYHSALQKAISAPRLNRYAHPNGSVAFAHDVLDAPPTAGLPPEFDPCDIIYAEPPWRDGFDRFNRRAGVTNPRTYPELLARLTGIIEATRTPLVLTLGKHALLHLPRPDQLLDIKLWGGRALLGTYRTRLPETISTNQEAMDHLAEQHQYVGDFMCGYGVTGRTFAARGKRFVLSDMNSMCIGFIAKHAEDWYPG